MLSPLLLFAALSNPHAIPTARPTQNTAGLTVHYKAIMAMAEAYTCKESCQVTFNENSSKPGANVDACLRTLQSCVKSCDLLLPE